MSRTALGLLLALLVTFPASAADPALPKELALVPPDAMVFASANVAALGENPAFKGLLDGLVKSRAADEFTAATGLKLQDLTRAILVMPFPTKFLGNGRVPEPEPIFVLTTKRPIDKAAVIKAGTFYTADEIKSIVTNRQTGEKVPPPSGKADASLYYNKARMSLAFAGDRTLVIGVADVERATQLPPSPLDRLKPKDDVTPLAEGIALAAKHPVAVALNMSQLRQLAELDAPPPPILPLLKADKAVGYATINKNAAEFRFGVEFAGMKWSADGEEAAKGLKELAVFELKDDAKRAFKREGDGSVFGKFAAAFAGMIEKAAVTRKGNTVTLAGALDLGPETQKLLAALPAATTEAAAVLTSQNNLKQIGLAFHVFHDANGFMPSNVHDKAGKPLLSWRVHLLQYIEQGDLYRKFKLDEPWDSEHNKMLIEKMPKTFALPGVKTKEAGHTFYRAFINRKGAAQRALMAEGESKGPSIVGIVDGTVSTILCVEAAESCVWTKPDDLPFDPDGPLPKLGGHFAKDRFGVALCDGSVRVMDAKMPAAKLKAYITINGGELIQDD
jgi:hypothetical protein